MDGKEASRDMRDKKERGGGRKGGICRNRVVGRNRGVRK